MKELIVRNFNTVLVLSVVIGLFMPWLDAVPKSSAIILISIAIFFSCSKVSIDELRHVNVKAAALFYVVRFLLLPIPVYFIANYFVPEYALGILLVTLAPVGASSTAVASLMRANTSLSLSSTIVTNSLAPLSIPVLVFLLGGTSIDINIVDLFITLSLSIFLPAIIYFGAVRRVKPLKLWIKKEANFLSVICIGGMMAAVTAIERDYILGNIVEVLYLVAIGALLFLVLYAVAWWFSFRMSKRDRSTYMICSGVNNTGLSAGIALLYFSPATILFAIVAEVPWVIGLILFKKYAEKRL